MRYLYYCNSAYQILNAINLNWHRKYKGYENVNDYESDIIILNAFNNAYELSEIIKELDFFDNVYLINRVSNSGIFHIVYSILFLLFPSIFLKKSGITDILKIMDVYDCLVVPKYSKASAAIWQLNKKAKLQLYEDGTGTYVDSMVLKNDREIYNRIFKKRNYGRDFNEFESIYLNRPELYCGVFISKIKKIDDFDDNCLSILKEKILTKSNTNDFEKSIFWFSQFIGNSVNKIIKESLINYKEEVLFFPHPRFQIFDNRVFAEHKNNISWELESTKIEAFEEKCLITIHSTAVFSPKIMFNKEPHIIFTYKMLKDNDKSDFRVLNELVERLRDIYVRKERIFTPSSEDELQKNIQTFLNLNR